MSDATQASLAVQGSDHPALDQLLPMHVRLSTDGKVLHVGPTMRKILGRDDVRGADFFDLFEVHRPRKYQAASELFDAAGERIALALTDRPDMMLRANLACLQDQGGAVVDISLGLSFVRAVAEFSLTLGDFSPSDQTIDLLYLHEANSSTARLSRHLTERLKSAHAAAQHQARTDELTGLANRRSIDTDLERLLADTHEDFSLMQIDLDLFKAVNDTHGHPAGDAVLRAVGSIFAEELRRNDIPSRVGGDEFLVVLRDVVEPAVAGRVAARLIERIEEPVLFEGIECRISASIGIATIAQYAERPSLKEITADVDAALYRAKNNGRGQYAFHSNIVHRSDERRALGRVDGPRYA